MERNISFGEIFALNQKFEQYLLDNGITILDDDYRTEAFNDYLDQYQNGNDNPEVNLY